MDGIHDLGGKHGFGAVRYGDDPYCGAGDSYDQQAPPLPTRWEGIVFTVFNTLLRQGVASNIDYFRHAIERIDPLCYLQDEYYGRWLGAIETVVQEAGLLTREALDTAAQARAVATGRDAQPSPAARPDPRLRPETLGAARGAKRTLARAPRYKPGDRVQATSQSVPGHTRLPAYIRGRVGVVVRCQGAWVFPDTRAHGGGEQPQHVYSVRFAGEELWGAAAESGSSVCIDLFEPYLAEPLEVANVNSKSRPGAERP